MFRYFLPILLVLVPVVHAADAPSGASVQGAEVKGEALVLKTQMEKLFVLSKDVNSSNAAKRRAGRAAVLGALDWDRAAATCVGPKDWQKQSAKSQAAFRDLLRDVITLSAFERLDKFWADITSYTFYKFDMKAKTAFFMSEFKVKNGENYLLEYYLMKKGARWLIEDISYEGMRYKENIAEQVTSFLKENSFPKLIEKLQKRKADLQQDAKP
jgi:ABC-type transporter MlaC component